MSRSFENQYIQATDGLQLYGRIYPHPAATHNLLIVHGHGEHIGRYDDFAQRLERVPCNLIFFDLRGNGRSEGDRVAVDSFLTYLKDISSVTERIRQHRLTQSKHLLLLGHSLGGLIALRWAISFGKDLKGLILSCPLFGLRLAPLIHPLAKILKALTPNLVLKNPVHPPFLSHDLEEVKRYCADSLIQKAMAVSLLNEIVSETTRLKCQNQFKLPMPLLGLFAGDDKVVSGEAGIRVFQGLQSERKELRIYPGMFHELFHEKNRGQVYEDLCQFLRSIV